MDLNAEGWSRNMGSNRIGSFEITSAAVVEEGEGCPPDKPVIRILEDGATRVGWRAELSLNGAYLVTLDFSKKDVARLFMLLFGNNLDPATLAQYGFKVDADDFAAEMLLDKPLGDIIDCLSRHRNKRANETPIEMDVLSPRT